MPIDQNAPSLLPQVTGIADQEPDQMIQSALDFVRTHLKMEVAYLSEFVDEDLVFRAVSAPGFEKLCHVGAQIPLDQVYCRHILAGRLPELIPDTSVEPICQGLPLTQNIPIKSHVSVPIRRRDGRPYGMFCCLSRDTRADLTPRDLDVMRAFASLSADQINDRIAIRLETSRVRTSVTSIISARDFDIVFQPIFKADNLHPTGFEALSRFRTDPYRPPNHWFEDAARVGLDVELELAAIDSALTALEALPADMYLSVNAGPKTLMSGQLPDVFAKHDTHRILLELTEHAKIDDYDALLDALQPLRDKGVRLAIDDAGAGYSGLQHIVQLQPDVIKLDMSLTRNVDKDVVRRSLAAALVRFGSEINAKIVAEGIETKGELAALKDLGVPLMQGYLLGKPTDLNAARAAWFAPNMRQRA